VFFLVVMEPNNRGRVVYWQVQTILADNRCQELWKLLQSAQNSEIITKQDVVRYRREAERHVGQDDHLYRIQWVSSMFSTGSTLDWL
jgi:histone deacetylase complex regulatory component SIN3